MPVRLLHFRRATLAAALLAPAIARAAGMPPTADCAAPATPLHAIQGSGRTSPLLGRDDVVVDAVVVGSFPGYPHGLGGFFLQEEDTDVDGEPETSEGLFVFDAGLGHGLALGDRVRVRGRVSEFFGLTELSPVSELGVCPPRGPASPVRVRLPLPDPDAWERWEGMRVRIDQTLVASGHADLLRFGEVDLATPERLWQSTQRALPGAPALALAAENARRRILLDDGSDATDPAPTPYLAHRGGQTLRLGDTLPSLEGVVDFAFGRYRIHPTRPVRLEPAGERPALPPQVGGTLHLVIWNVENHFNGDGRGGGFPTRGPRTPEALEHQRAKLVETLARLDPDVAALVELENDGTGPESAIGQLVAALNRRTDGAPYTVVQHAEAPLGMHPIAVAIIYRPSAVAALGPPAVLDARAHPGFDDRRNRPSLAWSFTARATGERLTLAVSHLKSKGSSCAAAGDPDRGDGQGACNETRRRAARALVEWLATSPTGVADAPVLVVGDLNAYPHEDPLQEILAAGSVDLLERFGGPDAYSYVFDAAAGRLDHALAGAELLPLVAGAAVWHTNADEPRGLGDRAMPDTATLPFRASDHDPLRIGLFPDADRDGVTDPRDPCPQSLRAPTVTLGACDTGVPERLDEGCTLADRLSALRDAAQPHGRTVREATRWLAQRIADGTLARHHRGPLLACLAALREDPARDAPAASASAPPGPAAPPRAARSLPAPARRR